ncbi:ATP-binding protein [Vibrio maerlii]|uniref:ATP-binding protein n=1 Tax=Vibrio maerlii TaxID=2231648 RepID=UPI000E3BF08D|nr:ATP-binding protein [Vibrio maerlii]
MNKSKPLFLAAFVITLLMLTAAYFLYLESERLAKHRMTLGGVGHELIELKDRVTKQALNQTSDPFYLANAVVGMEQNIEDMLTTYQRESKGTVGLYKQETYSAIKEFTVDAVLITDALDHVIGLLVAQESMLASLTKQLAYEAENSTLNSAQRNILLRKLQSAQINIEEYPKLSNIINSYQEVEKQKQALFAFLLNHENTNFVERVEHQMNDFETLTRGHIVQLETSFILIIAIVAFTLYLFRMKEIKTNQRALEETLKQKDKANHAKSMFLANMSHELRTPMNGVLGLAQIIKEESPDPESREHAKVIVDSGQHLVTLLNDILDFSKVEEGKMELESRPFVIDEVIQHLIHSLSPLADDKNIEFNINNSIPSNVRLHGDSARLRQILFNLAGNAIKFTNIGHVDVKIELNYTPQSLLHIQVADSGVGIERHKLDTIFSPFEQADLSTTRKFGGTGLGLAIVKQLAELMGGEVEIFSQPNVGTEFTLNIPIGFEVIKDEQPQQHPIQNETDNLPALSILLVEDNRVNAIVAQSFLNSCGHTIEWVTDGLLAIDKLKEQRFDLIVMDNHMPNLSGVETIKRVRQELNLDTAIFAYTADVFKEAHDEFLTAGADFVLTKPLQKQNLERAIRQFEDIVYRHKVASPSCDQASNVVSLFRPSVERLALTEEELSQSPMINEMELSDEETIVLLQSVHEEFETKSLAVIEAFSNNNVKELHSLLHSIKGSSAEMQFSNLTSLSGEAELSARNGTVPDGDILQKLINLMLVNSHQTQRMIKQIQNHQQAG